MKNLSFLIILGLLASLSPALACDGEAQFIAKVGSRTFSLSQGCKVTLTEVRHFSSNPFCPLSLDEINTSELLVGTLNGHECAYDIGDEVSGVAVKQGARFILE